MVGRGGGHQLIKSNLEMVSHTVSTEGFRGLYRGMLPSLVRVAPLAGLGALGLEGVKAHVIGE